MRIGVDFDNTIVCYDELFHRVALENDLIPVDLPRMKSSVRDHLRRAGKEEEWTRLQGVVYGPRMSEAAPFPGAWSFFRRCSAWGVRPLIISHRTRTPYLGPPYDLHESARMWLEEKGFLGEDGAGVPRENVYLETTREEKLRRIALVQCSIFLDDLPEFLGDPAFDRCVERVLFDPSGSHGAETADARVASWTEFAQWVQSRIGGHGREGTP